MARGAGIILAAAVLGLGATAADGAGLWDPHGTPPPIPRHPTTTPQAQAASGVCELRSADRARTPSTRCIACHDGTIGTAIPFQMSPDGNGMSHPVEVDYGAAAARDPTHYHARGALPREVPLVDGRVACTSCHDGASPDPKRVVAIPRLCESCHNL